MRFTFPAFAAALVAMPVLAETCPPAPDHSTALTALFAAANAAQSETEGRAIGNRMWEYWADAPDARAQELLDSGIAARAAHDFETAMAAFDALVAYCPDYAEGYNQRGFVHFIRQDYVAALDDLEHAVERSPRHVAALAGLGLTLMALGRVEAAQGAIREAAALNPWIPERNFLIDRNPPAGQEL